MHNHAYYDSLERVQIPNSYFLIPSKWIDTVALDEYTRLLNTFGYLNKRFCEDSTTTPEQAVHYWLTNNSYFALDSMTKEIVLEFTLDNSRGKAIQVHQSFSPNIEYKTKVLLSKMISSSLLRDFYINSEETMYSALYGITPTENKTACLFAVQSGFKRQFVLPLGIKYMGKLSDALITTKQVNDNGK